MYKKLIFICIGLFYLSYFNLFKMSNSQPILYETEYDISNVQVTPEIVEEIEIHDKTCECVSCVNEHKANIKMIKEDIDGYIQKRNDERDAYIQKMNDERDAYVQKFKKEMFWQPQRFVINCRLQSGRYR